MKDLSMLVWLTQLGISVVSPPVVFIFFALWLRSQFGWGDWVIWAALILGAVCAISGFQQSLKLMKQAADRADKKTKPPAGFNEHF